MPETPQQPAYNPQYIASGRGPWNGSSPKNVIVIDPGRERQARHKHDTLTLADGRKLPMEDAYEKARGAFDSSAAHAFVNRMLDNLAPEKIRELREKFNRNPPVIIWERADPFLDGTPHNALPTAYAQALSERLGWKCAHDDYLHRINPSGRKGSSTLELLVKQPFYSGHITPGRNYLVIEDHIKGGSTVANITSFIEAQGGHVAGITVLNDSGEITHLDRKTGQEKSVLLQPSQRRMDQVIDIIGKQNFSDLHQAFFGRQAFFPDSSSGKEVQDCRFTDGELTLLLKHLKGHASRRQEKTFLDLVEQIVPLALEREQELYRALTGHTQKAHVMSEIEHVREAARYSWDCITAQTTAPIRPDASSYKNSGRVPVLPRSPRQPITPGR